MLFEIRGLLQNAAMGIAPIRNFASRYHVTGMNGDPERVRERFDLYSRHIDVRGADVLELGPGQTPQVLTHAIESGARSATGIDIQAYDDAISKRHGEVQIDFYDGRALPYADAAFDAVWSSDVLEHVRFAEITIAESFRVLRPGGLFFARVDLRDHYFILDETKWFNCLRYPEPLWNAMTRNRSAHVNRLRAGDWDRLLRSAGFEVVVFERSISEVQRERFVRNDLPAWGRKLTVDDATTWRLEIVARKPGTNPRARR